MSLARAYQRVAPLEQQQQRPVHSSASLLATWLNNRHLNLCINCDEPFSRDHKCKHLFYIEFLDDLIDMEGDVSLMALLGKGGSIMCI